MSEVLVFAAVLVPCALAGFVLWIVERERREERQRWFDLLTDQEDRLLSKNLGEFKAATGRVPAISGERHRTDADEAAIEARRLGKPAPSTRPERAA